MGKLNDLVADHSTKPVPDHEKCGGFRLALIIIGVSIALPAFVSGAQLGQQIGIKNSMIAFFIGGLILTVVGSFTGIVAAKSRLTTYMLVKFSFGPTGAHIVNFVLAATMFGWFGVNASLFGEAVLAAFRDLGWTESSDTGVYVMVGSALMVMTTVFGFKAIDKLSLIAVPILIVILVTIMWKSAQAATVDEILAAGSRDMPLGLAISAVAGSNMVMVAALPDIARYLSKSHQAIVAVFIAYVIGEPLILLCSAIPSLVTGDPDLMNIVFALGLGNVGACGHGVCDVDVQCVEPLRVWLEPGRDLQERPPVEADRTIGGLRNCNSAGWNHRRLYSVSHFPGRADSTDRGDLRCAFLCLRRAVVRSSGPR